MGLFAPLLDMRPIVPFHNCVRCRRALVARIGAEIVLPARPGISMTSWSSVASSSFTSCVFAPLATIDNGTPIPVDQQASFAPIFFPDPWVGAHAFGRKWRFVHRAVDTLPIPCNGFHLVVLSQSGLPQTKKEPACCHF